MPFVYSTLSRFIYHVYCLPCFETKNRIRCIDAPRHAFIHTEIYPNLKSISESFKMYIIYEWVSCNQTLGCLRLYGDSRVSRAQPRINAYEILLQHDWLLLFFCFFCIMFWNKLFYFTYLDKLYFKKIWNLDKLYFLKKMKHFPFK